jgi:hypothetical protein
LYASALAISPDHLVATALLEAIAWVADTNQPAALLLADETWPGTEAPPLAVTLVLAPAQDTGVHLSLVPGAPCPSTPTTPLAQNPCGAVLPLLRVLHEATTATIPLSASPLHAQVTLR